MAWISCEFRSETLNMPVEAEILVPQANDRTSNYTENLKVIILLHGANWDRCEWLLKSHIFDLVREQPILVFMPSGKNSFYVNTVTGYRYMDYITKEIPNYIKKHFRVSKDRKDWLIAGESMGGYGALVNGLNATEQFGNIASFSGVVDIVSELRAPHNIPQDYVFGDNPDKVAESNLDVTSLCHKVDKTIRPNIFMNCGKQDRFYPMNAEFYENIRDEYDVTAVLDKDGAHDFVYWNPRLDEMIPWFMEHSNKY